MTHFRPLWLSLDRSAMREVLSKLGDPPRGRAKHVRSMTERLYHETALADLLSAADESVLGQIER